MLEKKEAEKRKGKEAKKEKFSLREAIAKKRHKRVSELKGRKVTVKRDPKNLIISASDEEEESPSDENKRKRGR